MSEKIESNLDHILLAPIMVTLGLITNMEEKMIELIFLLIASHFIADYPLQSEAIALGKNRNIEYAKFGVPWYYWLTAHSFVHAMGVYLVTQNVYLGLVELFCHFSIDFLKCEGKINLHVDQILHILCKILIVSIYYIMYI